MTLQKQKRPVISKDSFHYKHVKKKKNSHYLKPYYPYLPILLLIVFGSLLIISTKDTSQKSNDLSISSLIDSTNKIKNSYGLSKTFLNSSLSSIAQNTANQLSKKNNQNLLNNESVAIGFNNSEQTLRAWLSNETTRNKLLTSNNVGFGIFKSATNVQKDIVVAVFESTTGNATHITFYVPNKVVNASQASIPISNQKLISRVTILTKNPFYQIFVIGVISVLIVLFLLRHLIFFKKIIFEGEKILLNNVWLDVALIILIFTGIYLTQTIGKII